MRNLSFLLVALAALMLSTPALATGDQDHTCQGGHNCSGGSVGDVSSSSTALGAGVGVGIGKGGNASATNNTAVDVHSRNVNRNNLNNSNTNVGINEQGQGQHQDQGQQQGQVGIVRDGDVTVAGDSFSVEGDEILYEAPDIPVNSAAPVFAGACSQGISGQGHGFGASVASGNPVCDYVAVAGGFVASGDRSEAVRVLGKAEDAADWRFFFSRVRMVLTLGLL